MNVKGEITINNLFVLTLKEKHMFAKELAQILSCAPSTISARLNELENLWTETVVSMFDAMGMKFELLNSEKKKVNIESYVTMNQIRKNLGEFYFRFQDGSVYKIIPKN